MCPSPLPQIITCILGIIPALPTHSWFVIGLHGQKVCKVGRMAWTHNTHVYCLTDLSVVSLYTQGTNLVLFVHFILLFHFHIHMHRDCTTRIRHLAKHIGWRNRHKAVITWCIESSGTSLFWAPACGLSIPTQQFPGGWVVVQTCRLILHRAVMDYFQFQVLIYTSYNSWSSL